MNASTNSSPPDPAPIRVDVADGSAFVRSAVGQLLETDPGMSVTGTPRNLDDLFENAARHAPDVVVINTRLLVSNIRDVLDRLKQECERVPAILVCCPPSSAGCHEALQALCDGAAEVVALDQSTLSGQLSDLRAELLSKIRLIAARKHLPVNPAASQAVSLQGRGVHLIAIGAGSGGPPVLERILTQLPPQLPCPIVIAQHLPPMCAKALVERLDSVCAISIVRGEHGMLLHPGSAYLIPSTGDGRVRAIGPGPIRLEVPSDPNAHHNHPSINELLTSAARQCAHHTLGIILSGAEGDAGLGAAEILKARGDVIAQCPASALFPSMPAAAINARATSMTPDHIAASLASLATDASRRAA